MKRAIVAISIICFTFLINSCDTNEPFDDNGNGVDTTSHNFTFRSWSFGEHSSSALGDVAIIDENNIWAVGEIYLNDSLGQPDPTPYNAVHWDGMSWVITRIPTKTFSGTNVSSQIRTVFAFNENDIWTFSIAGSYSHWNGSNWETEFVSERDGSGNKLWGTSSFDLYLVCTNGGISYYNGTSWQKIESGTELNFYEIYGQRTINGGYEIMCVASDLFLNQGKKILKIENNNVSTIPDAGLSNSLHTVWFIPEKKYFIGGDGLFSTNSLSEDWKRNTELPSYYKDAVRGNSINDIIVVGAFGLVLHYNGNSWKSFQDIKYLNGELGRVDIKGPVVCAVGYNDNKAVITLGKRN